MIGIGLNSHHARKQQIRKDLLFHYAPEMAYNDYTRASAAFYTTRDSVLRLPGTIGNYAQTTAQSPTHTDAFSIEFEARLSGASSSRGILEWGSRFRILELGGDKYAAHFWDTSIDSWRGTNPSAFGDLSISRRIRVSYDGAGTFTWETWNGVGWDFHSTSTTDTVSMFARTTSTNIGLRDQNSSLGGMWKGDIGRVVYENETADVSLNVDFTRQIGGVTSFKASTGQTITVNQSGTPSAAIVPEGIRGTNRNLLKWSEALDNAVWTKGSVTVTADAFASDGGIVFDKVVETAITNNHELSQGVSVSVQDNSKLTVQATFAAGGGRDVVDLVGRTKDLTYPFIRVDLATGTVVNSPSSTITDYFVEEVEAGVYRAQMTYDVKSGSNDPRFFVRLYNGSTNNYLGDGVSGTYATRLAASFGTTLDYQKTEAIPGSDVLREVHQERNPVTGLYIPTVLLEGQRTNILFESSHFAGSSWGVHVDFAEEAALSILRGQVARKFTNTGTGSSRPVNQTRGVLTASPETFYAIVENVNAQRFGIGIRDETAGAWVFYGNVDWSTKAFTLGGGSGTARVQELAGIGPNGGEILLVSVTATPTTAGNSRSCYVYPTGTPAPSTANQASILHHAQHEEAPVHSSPIITGSAAVARAVDNLSFNWSHAPQEKTIYARFIEKGTSYQYGRLLSIFNDGGNVAPWLIIDSHPTDRYYRIRHEDGGGAVESKMAVKPDVGDLCELRATLTADGKVQVSLSIDEGAEASATQSVTSTLGAAWGGTPKLHVAHLNDNEHGPNAFNRIAICKGIRSLDYMRRRANI